MTRKEGLLIVEQKVEDFQKGEAGFLLKSFQETETRDRFIDPFFEALGWEMKQTGVSRQYWDVHREFSLKDDSSTKKPDYAFRVKDIGVPHDKFKEKFFVEAKAPWVSLTDAKPVFQAKRYAFSSHGKAPIAILTDFQEFRVFNGLERPRFENPLQGLIKELDLKYTDYLAKWEILWANFSKEAVYDGSIENLAGKVSRNTKTLDDEFLNDIIEWRETLARNVAIRNKNLSVDEINEAVQRILDRLVFIRNLEDRNIEDENLLMNLVDRQDYEDAHFYKCIIPLFRKFDIDYNGLLFKKHFSEELEIDNKIIKDIIKSMSSEVSPFRFDIIEPEILGHIYERFLGSKIRLTEDHRAKVEMKPEVNHAGGVFYTPEYIVKYIVENTVGEKVKDKTPEEIEQLKILDPACGSGSFLLGAFDYLIKYHQDYYSKLSKTARKKYKDYFFETPDGEIRLTLQKKGRILKNNIFGVDIDREATEVSIMSLYLKLLDEGFDKGQALLFMRGHILPDMTANIKCGNSLIDREQLFSNDLFGDEDIKPFDWDTEFWIGGFDCIIGNPPYIRIQEMQKWAPKTVSIYKNIYKSGSSNNFDIFVLFLEKALMLLNQKGLYGFIVPNKFMQQEYGQNIREILSSGKHIFQIINFKDFQVFKNATTYTSLVFASKNPNISFNYAEVKNELVNFHLTQKDFSSITADPWLLHDEKDELLIKSLSKYPILADLSTNIFVGVQTSADKIFILDFIEEKENSYVLYSKSVERQIELEKTYVKHVISGLDVKRYLIPPKRQYIIFPYKIENEKAILLSKADLENNSPKLWEYLFENKKVLEDRENGRLKGKGWYGYIYLKNMSLQDKPKLCVPRLVQKIQCTFDANGSYCLDNVDVGGVILKEEYNHLYYYIMGLLNSSLLSFYLTKISTPFRGGFWSCNKQYLEKLPIYLHYPQDKDKYALCQKIEEMVKQIIELKKDEKRLKDAEFLERKIDEMVEKIYLE